MRFKLFLFFYLPLILLGISCKDTNSNSTSETVVDAIDSTKLEKVEEQKPETIVFAWVDKLRVRAEATVKSEIVEEIAEGAALTYLEEKTDFTERYTFRGESQDEPWLKVKTAAGKIGWVHGGGVKFYEPKLAAVPSPYDRCFDYYKRRRMTKAQECVSNKESAQLRKDKRFVEVLDNRGLSFNLLSGEKLEMHPNNDSLYHNYNYRYYLPKMSVFVVEASNVGKSDYMLINDKSGKQTIIPGYPVISPDFKYLLSISAGTIYPKEKHRVELLTYGDNGLEVIWEKDLTKYEPIIAKWTDAGVAEITVLPSNKKKSIKLNVAKLKLKDDQTWEWEL